MTSSTQSKICFFFQTSVTLRQRTKLKNFLESLFRKEKKQLQGINYIFCTDQELLEINRQYLNHDYYTDIISFELSAKGQPVEGEIYISIDRIKDNALKLNEPLTRELHRVIFHGALHLCGYKDKTFGQKKEMRHLEENYLKNYLE